MVCSILNYLTHYYKYQIHWINGYDLRIIDADFILNVVLNKVINWKLF